ncbi:adenylate/guanylate cyclase domain-containing protein [Microcoleus sp. bin38.metabat.b11b12b14.051]|uniref:adenylate/guanylate cyclase domain-containing protein n=1 Tax=Microcoleus sp. bin38.metabat.b11b12b14.051 TaxID=2742709 RepID=UPI0025ED6179|nr:adenylate/guanylate cyclase domain-containing protein [Microcoleus sp. bin38.metabat.b11b12b14.051]
MNSFASSTNKYSPTDVTVDVVEVESVVVGAENHNHQQHQEIYAPSPSSSIAIIPYDGNFSSILAPLNKQSFKAVAKGVEEKLKVVNQTLGMLDNILDSEGFDAILNEMLQSITVKTGELLNADRSTIFLLDDDKNELFAIVAQDENGQNLEIRFPATLGIAGEVATDRKVVNIPYDFYNDPRSANAKKTDEKTGYRTYTMLAMPLVNEETDELVAVVQLINKLKPDHENHATIHEQIDKSGFTKEDEGVFEEFAPSIRLILESSKSFYAATQRQRAATALMNAVNALSQSSLDLEDTLKRVMDQAKELMNADRSTLWLIDEDKDELWTKLPNIEGKLTEIRIPRTAGFAGIVAQSSEPLLIPFDVYEDSRAVTSRATDEKTGYRTCSMLCMPVFNSDHKLIGVTQLVNKKRQGDFPPYNPADWPHAPEQWKASFNRNDLEFMKSFNIQAGVALQNAKLFAEVKQQEQRQKDMLHALTNGVISTDKRGNIVATNPSAQKLLGVSEAELAEGQSLRELIKLEKGDFAKWFDSSLNPADEKDRQQYYPDQILISCAGESQSINLSINSMTDATDPNKVNGALVVMEDISSAKQVKNLMYRYMTPEVAEALLASGDTGLGGKRKNVSVLFSDIRSYTTLTEKLQAEEVVVMLNKYFEVMVDVVFEYGGTLDKYIGDALMAVFGSPAPLEDHAWCAMQTAVKMRSELDKFNDDRMANGELPISIGMGIHSDQVVSGNIGSSKRMELTSIGDGVNLASRLEGASKQYGTDLIISDNTYKDYKDRLYVRELDFITVKGKSEPVIVYELVGIREGYSPIGKSLTETQQQVVEHYNKAREHYKTPVTQRLSDSEVKNILDNVAAMPDAEIKKLSYSVDQQLEQELKKLLHQLKKLSDYDPKNLSEADKMIVLLQPEIQLLKLEGLKNLSEDEAKMLLQAKIKQLSADDIQSLQEGEVKKLLEADILEPSNPQIKRLKPAQIRQLLQAKIKSRASETVAEMLDEEFENLGIDRVKKLLSEFKKVLEPKAKQAFRDAEREFNFVLEVEPKNKAAKLHVDRCGLYKLSPPDVLNWDGVWQLTEK